MEENISSISKLLFNTIFAKGKNMFKIMWRDFVKFLKTKPLYFLCSFLYYILASSIFGLPEGLLLAGVFYIVSILIAFSPLGEILLRILEHVRKIETKQEKEYLLPLFQEVYGQAKRKNPELGKIELCVIDKITVNACAVGKRTIAVTKGAIATFSPDELKALMAHEIAHILYGDTIAKIYALIGNGFFTIFVLSTNIFIMIAEWIESLFKKTSGFNFALFFVTLVRFIFNLFVIVVSFLMQIVMSIYSRPSEYRADSYAYELGYGEELVKTFYLLEKMQLSDNLTIIQQMAKDHPRITARIGRLEILLDQEEAIQTAP